VGSHSLKQLPFSSSYSRLRRCRKQSSASSSIDQAGFGVRCEIVDDPLWPNIKKILFATPDELMPIRKTGPNF
jgi:hypothetical protein